MLNATQLDDYSNEGYVFVPELLPEGDISAVMAQLPELCALERPEVIFEKNSLTVRSLMNVHTYSEAADKLIYISDNLIVRSFRSHFLFFSVPDDKTTLAARGTWEWETSGPA